ncbi:MAG TPA: NAD(P)-dependent alcohol dehydrogenase [Candidatus Udaeobacter sp.]|nr:NAD(P)-dependent alcohol dehydrogenase [Candidatus Udaeobacter sp.]
MTSEPKPKRAHKRWKRVIKWALGAIFLLLILCGVIAYWTSTNDCERYSGVPAEPIKAVVKCEYGTPDVLQVKDVEKPKPDDTQVLVRVRAASLNPLDGHFVRGMLLARVMGGGLRKPKDTGVGVDYAGVVEAVGKKVTQYKVGDEVFGGRTGALAQYVCAKADRAIALKPATVTFEEAGSIAVAGITALQGLRDVAHVQPGQKVLINGASGGVGTFAVQIAKALGAEVTGVCSTRNVDLVKSLGADHVIDYTKEDFTKGDRRYDVLFDNIQNHSFSERRRILAPNGICLNVGLGGAGWHEDSWLHMARSFTTPLMSKFTSQKFKFFIAELNHNDLAYLADLMQTGKMKPVIDRAYKSLSESPQALAYLEQGHARGKVVLTVE